jgi:hypothetical protein
VLSFLSFFVLCKAKPLFKLEHLMEAKRRKENFPIHKESVKRKSKKENIKED